MWISSCEADEAIGGLSGYPVKQSRRGDTGYLDEELTTSQGGVLGRANFEL